MTAKVLQLPTDDDTRYAGGDDSVEECAHLVGMSGVSVDGCRVRRWAGECWCGGECTGCRQYGRGGSSGPGDSGATLGCRGSIDRLGVHGDSDDWGGCVAACAVLTQLSGAVTGRRVRHGGSRRHNLPPRMKARMTQIWKGAPK
jgi:hypothetical protein